MTKAKAKKNESEQKKNEGGSSQNKVCCLVKCVGIVPMMLDRIDPERARKVNTGEDKKALVNMPPGEKMYFDPEDGKTLVFPAPNVLSFLVSEHTTSCAKLFMDAKEYKRFAKYVAGYTAIDPIDIPITRGGKPIVFSGFDEKGRDQAAQIYVDRRVAKLKDGSFNPKARPLIRKPWEVEFKLHIYPNARGVTEKLLREWFTEGGQVIGFGTFRGLFGKFDVRWERI